MLLPADWAAGTFEWDSSGLELAVIRNEARPEPARQHQTLWVMDLRHGTLRKVFDPPTETSFIFGVKWSPDRLGPVLGSAATRGSFGAGGGLTSLPGGDRGYPPAARPRVTPQDRARGPRARE